MDIKKESFVFYRSFYEAFDILNPEEYSEIVRAMCAYALDGELPTFKDKTAQLAWTLIKPQLDANTRKYINGKKGGAPKGSHNNPNGRRGITEPEPEQDPQPEHDVTPTNETSADGSIPTLEEVHRFFEENSMADQAEKFYLYNESRGWIIGNSPVRSWKSMAHRWMNKVKDSNPNYGDPVLGIGEYRTSEGHRTYGPGEVIVPESAAPRPGNTYWWNTISMQWDNAA